MVRSFAVLSILMLLGACSGNPFDKLTRLSDVPLANDPVSVAVAEAIEKEPEQDDEALPSADETIVADVTAERSDPTAEKGFFGRLLSGIAPTDPQEPPQIEATADAPPALDTPTPDVVGVTADIVAETETAPMPAPQQAGFFGRLFSGTSSSPAATEQSDDSDAAATPTATPANAGTRGGLFSRLTPERTGPDAALVTVGTQVPYGTIATNCDVSRSQLGTKVGSASGYTLYDTIPNATSLRTHYIMGFKDRCARQFSAATALMGDVGTHEVVRYLPSNKRVAYSVTDNAYEDIKASFCRVGRGQPCGSKLDRLSKSTTFITAYRNFGSNPAWSNILLHNGTVVAMGEASR